MNSEPAMQHERTNGECECKASNPPALVPLSCFLYLYLDFPGKITLKDLGITSLFL